MMLKLLFVLLILVLYITYHLSDKVLCAPQFVYVFAFTVSVGGAIIYAEFWGLNLHKETFLCILGSVLLFSFTSLTFKIIYDKRVRRINKNSEKPEIYDDLSKIYKKIRIDYIWLWIFIVFQLSLIIYQVLFLLRFGGGSLSSAIYSFRTRDDTSFNYPSYIKLAIGVSQASGYIWIYLLMHSLVYNYRIKGISLIIGNIGLCFVRILLSGSRGLIIDLLIAGVAQMYIFYGFKNGWKKKIPFKYISVALVGLIIVVSSFKFLGSIIGRKDSIDANQYVGIYLSGSIYNLNDYISKGDFGSSFAESEVFLRLTNNIGAIFNIPDFIHDTSFEFVYSRGHFIGNVYTILGPYMHDGGYLGVAVFTVIMAIISQISFLSSISLKSHNNLNKFSMSVILFSYVFTATLYSFFHGRFYADIFNKNFFQMVIYIYLIRFVFLKTHFEK